MTMLFGFNLGLGMILSIVSALIVLTMDFKDMTSNKSGIVATFLMNLLTMNVMGMIIMVVLVKFRQHILKQ